MNTKYIFYIIGALALNILNTDASQRRGTHTLGQQQQVTRIIANINKELRNNNYDAAMTLIEQAARDRSIRAADMRHIKSSLESTITRMKRSGLHAPVIRKVENLEKRVKNVVSKKQDEESTTSFPVKESEDGDPAAAPDVDPKKPFIDDVTAIEDIWKEIKQSPLKDTIISLIEKIENISPLTSPTSYTNPSNIRTRLFSYQNLMQSDQGTDFLNMMRTLLVDPLYKEYQSDSNQINHLNTSYDITNQESLRSLILTAASLLPPLLKSLNNNIANFMNRCEALAEYYKPLPDIQEPIIPTPASSGAVVPPLDPMKSHPIPTAGTPESEKLKNLIEKANFLMGQLDYALKGDTLSQSLGLEPNDKIQKAFDDNKNKLKVTDIWDAEHLPNTNEYNTILAAVQVGQAPINDFEVWVNNLEAIKQAIEKADNDAFKKIEIDPKTEFIEKLQNEYQGFFNKEPHASKIYEHITNKDWTIGEDPTVLNDQDRNFIKGYIGNILNLEQEILKYLLAIASSKFPAQGKKVNYNDIFNDALGVSKLKPTIPRINNVIKPTIKEHPLALDDLIQYRDKLKTFWETNKS